MADDKKVDFEGRTAADALAPNLDGGVDAEAAERAEGAGVVDAAYVDYDAALQNYEARPDIETLDERRARENGGAFRETDFVREGKSGVAAATADDEKVSDKKGTSKKPDTK